ncbi:hypothetical protein Tco_0896263 [Tanacetum coccineum]
MDYNKALHAELLAYRWEVRALHEQISVLQRQIQQGHNRTKEQEPARDPEPQDRPADAGAKEKGLLRRKGRSGGKFEGGFGGNVGSCGGRGRRGGSIVGRGGGSLAKRSMDSKDGLGANGEESLDGWVGASGAEVKGGGVDFRVSRTLLGEIPRVIMGESGGEAFRVDGGAD